MKSYKGILFSALFLACALTAAETPIKLMFSFEREGSVIEGKVLQKQRIFGADLKCRVTASDKELPQEAGNTILLGEWELPRNGEPLVFQKETAQLPERRRFIAKATVLTASGKELCSSACELTTPPNPKNWRGFKEGIPDGKVPAPWTPVQLEGNVVSVWGRRFIFCGNPLPAQIESQHVELLASPARLLLEPFPEEWSLQSARKIDDTTIQMRWTGRLAGTDAYQVTTEIYFDGVMRVEMDIPKCATVQKYAHLYPIRKEVARTLHRGPYAFGGVKTTYPVKGEAEYHPIRPQLFLFNDDVGFGWFDGMPFDWPLVKKEQALAVIPQEDCVALQVNYIDSPTELKEKRRYSTGIQPLPVRPMPAVEKGLRLCYAIRYNDERRPAWTGTVDYLPEGNIRQECGTVELRVRMDFDPATHKREELFWEASHGHIRFKFGWAPKGGVFAQIYEDYKTKVYVSTDWSPRQGEWNHLAVTWGDEMSVFVNGNKTAGAPFQGSNRAFPAMLHVGGVNVSVDALKISAHPRTDFALGDQPPVVDGDTLLLDNFDSVGYCNGRRATFPEKIDDEAEAGYLTPDAELGNGLWGGGIVPMKHPIRNLIEGYRFYGIDTFCYHASQYTDESFAGMYVAEPERLKRSVEEIHRLGGRAIIYINNSLSTVDRAWQAHEKDWLIHPVAAPFIAASRPHEKCYQACPRSEYIDYFFWRLASLLDDFQLDGGFLDGRMYASCNNELHGCGVADFEGRRVAQRDVWDGRLKAWRLYNIFKNRGCYCEQHKSSIWDAPTCFFWDAAWEGEQFMSQKWDRTKMKRTDILPVEAMRTQVNGFVYGLPSRFTAYLKQPFSAVENCTYSFVHGTTWTMTYRIHEAAVVAPYWKALDDFGATHEGFRPYWGKEPPALSTPHPMVKVSAYINNGKALLIIANFNEENPVTSGIVRLNMKALALKGPLLAIDTFSGKEIPISETGDFVIDVKCFRQHWVTIGGNCKTP
ncbi:MAG: hypothetical protein IJT83_15915 [Victivallales bacterium]|nr:hypothetical protein [Victivallales bacterium]